MIKTKSAATGKNRKRKASLWEKFYNVPHRTRLEERVKFLIQCNSRACGRNMPLSPNVFKHDCGAKDEWGRDIRVFDYPCPVTEFLEEHNGDINEFLRLRMAERGVTSIGELIGDQWDSKAEPMLNYANERLVAQYVFEELAREIAHAIGVEV